MAIDGVRWQKHYLCMPKCLSFKSKQSFFIQQNGGHLQYFTTLSLSLSLLTEVYNILDANAYL